MAVFVLLEACAAGNDPHRFEDGWRVATISKVGNSDTFSRPGTPSNDCRQTEPVGLSSRVYAEVVFHVFRHAQSRIVVLPEHSDLRKGDRVYVNVRDCAVPVATAQR